MNLIETIIFYLVIGACVAFAFYLSRTEENQRGLHFQLTMAFLFWPMYVPFILSNPTQKPSGEIPLQKINRKPDDELTVAISQVEKEFETALKSLDGWAENVLSSEKYRLEELRSAWNVQADRIRELDKLLANPESDDPLLQSNPDNIRVKQSEETRQENMIQLKEIRNQMHVDLIGTLAWVRELVTMIHLAKYSGAPASRAEELIGQIASAVEGLSEVSLWNQQEETTVP